MDEPISWLTVLDERRIWEIEQWLSGHSLTQAQSKRMRKIIADKVTHVRQWMPMMYATYYGMLKKIAEDHGYALALHGSLVRDMDLIAVPWVDNPKPHLDMLAAMRDCVDGVKREDGLPYDSTTQKPQGRISYTIQCDGGGYLDISVVPCATCEPVVGVLLKRSCVDCSVEPCKMVGNTARAQTCTYFKAVEKAKGKIWDVK